MAYSGGIPQPVGSAFGMQKHKKAVGGSDGLKYYVSAENAVGVKRLYVYDTQKRMWHIEDETAAMDFCRWDGTTYLLAEDGKIWTVDQDEGDNAEEDFDWFAEFGDITDDDPNKKGVSKFQIRLELGDGASCQMKVRFDSVGDWIPAGEKLTADVKRSYYLAIVPRRADHYRLRLEGHGECRVYSIARERYSGSELKSRA